MITGMNDNNKVEYIKNKLNKVTIDREEVQKLVEDRIGYIYDSLCLRYNIARDAQAELEIHKKKINPESAWRSAQRDKIRFYEILDDLIGEHK